MRKKIDSSSDVFVSWKVRNYIASLSFTFQADVKDMYSDLLL